MIIIVLAAALALSVAGWGFLMAVRAANRPYYLCRGDIRADRQNYFVCPSAAYREAAQ